MKGCLADQDDFDHLIQVLSPEELGKLQSLTYHDKMHYMEKLFEDIDVDKEKFEILKKTLCTRPAISCESKKISIKIINHFGHKLFSS